MDQARRHRFIRLIGVTVSVFLLFAALAAPAGADQDGYFDNFPGDATFAAGFYDQTSGTYQVLSTQNIPGVFRSDFDTAWTNLHDTFCDELEAGIKAGDGSWVKRNHCDPVPATSAELRAKTLGTNLIGLRYFIPGHDSASSIYAYDHDTFFGAENIDVRFDLTIDVVLRVAGGVGPESDISTPLSVQSATLSFSRARFSASVCTDDCALAEQKLNGTIINIADKIDIGSGNTLIHTSMNGLSYSGLTASVSPSAANFELLHDALPTLDPALPLGQVASTFHLGIITYPMQSVYGVDTKGFLWQQNSLLGLPYQHWVNRGKPGAGALVSGPAAVVGPSGTPNVFATGPGGNVFEYDGTSWHNLGHPAGTAAVGTPAAGANAGLAGVIVRAANGHIAELLQTATSTFSWVDLGHPAFGPIGVTPAVVVVGPYTAVVITKPNGGLMAREAYGPVWAAWHDLGTLPSPATTAPSVTWNGTFVSAFVTGLDHTIEQATWKPLQAASIGRITPTLISLGLPPVTSAPSATFQSNGLPVIFASDANGDLWQFTYVRINAVITGYTAVDNGTLLGATMGAPLAIPSSATGIAVASNSHAGETHLTGSRHTLIDHTALSRVTYQAHTSAFKGGGVWGPVFQSAQTGNAKVGLFSWTPDVFRAQSTVDGTLTCQAYADGLGWQPPVSDGQPCGVVGHDVDAIRFQRSDASTNPHVMYRCFTDNAWSAWIADGMPCGAPNLAHISSIQVQFTDAGVPSSSYRAQSQDIGFQPFTTDGGVAGTSGKRLEGIEVASNVGGALRCQPYVQDEGWQNQVQDNYGLCGTVGESKRLEAFTLMIAGGPPGVGVSYRSYMTGVGWGAWCSNGQVSGAPGKQLEQVQVVFTHSP